MALDSAGPGTMEQSLDLAQPPTKEQEQDFEQVSAGLPTKELLAGVDQATD